MIDAVLKILLVWAPVFYSALRLLPLAGPGRYAFCLGASGVVALVGSGALMWLLLVTSGLILPWVPVAALWALALGALLLGRLVPAWVRPLTDQTGPEGSALSRWEILAVAGLVALILLRLLSLLPDVLLRPLFAWDAWTVWGFEARVWLEQGRFIEFLPPGEWLTAPADAFVRDNLVPYPRLVPGLILWIAAGEPVWTGVGPGLLWLAAALSIALVIYGGLRMSGLSPVWSTAAAYAFFSLPLVNAHVSLYGYADLWLAAVIAVFAVFLLQAERDQRRLWSILALVVLLFLPLIKLEGLYWLVCGVAALFFARLGLGIRTLLVLSAAAVGVVFLAAALGLDVLSWLTAGRLDASLSSLQTAVAGGVHHSFLWFDWHLLMYLVAGVWLLILIKPNLVDQCRPVAAFCAISLLILWGFTPLTGAGEFLADGTLFSRVFLQVSPVMVILVALVVHRVVEAYGRREALAGRPVARISAVMAMAALVLWAGWSVWVISNHDVRQVMSPVVIKPDALTWRLSEGQGQLTDDGFMVTAPSRLGRVLLAIQAPESLRADRFQRVELHFSGLAPSAVQFGWAHSPRFQSHRELPLEKTAQNIAELRLDDQDAWQGEIYWLAVHQTGLSSGPWTLQSVHLYPEQPGFWSLQRVLQDSLLIQLPWVQRNPHFIWPISVEPRVSPVLAVALWIILSVGVAALLMRRRRGAMIWVLLPAVAVGWIVLDMRWQVELGYKAGRTLSAFAAHPADQRFGHDLDREMFNFLNALEHHHQRSEFGRVFAFSETEFWRKRSRYHLASWGVRTAEASRLTPALARHLRSGDLLLLLEVPGIRLVPTENQSEPEDSQTFEIQTAQGERIAVGETISEQGDWIAIKIR